MKEYEPNTDNLKGIVDKLYHAITGNKPDDKMKERLYAGVEGMLELYKESPNAFYALAAVAVSEGAERLGFKSHYGNIILKYLAQSMIEESTYVPKDKLKLGGQ